jgi:meromycolic acid enoyl-[acyl-carrier-protein] reductase
MGILDGKRILVTGVLTDASIAFHVARIAQREGATVVLTGFGRLSLVERIARRLPELPPVLELDVTDTGQLSSLAERVAAHVDGLDGVVHSIGNAPASALGGNFLQTPWEDVAAALHVSTYSFKALAMAALPLMGAGGAIVGMGFEGFETMWGERAPLGWNLSNPEPAARACVALLSDWFPATTGEIVHVDGGVHAIGA